MAMTKSEALQQGAFELTKHGNYWWEIGNYKQAARHYEMAAIEALEALKAARVEANGG
jgi:hypothetical protein